MTIAQILADGKLTAAQKAEAIEMLTEERVKAASSGAARQISRNKSAGLFVRDTAVKAWSEAKQKHYTPSANLQWEMATALFGTDPTLRDEVCRFVQMEMKSKSKAA